MRCLNCESNWGVRGNLIDSHLNNNHVPSSFLRPGRDKQDRDGEASKGTEGNGRMRLRSARRIELSPTVGRDLPHVFPMLTMPGISYLRGKTEGGSSE
jgi:hypothetical protein